MPLIEATIMKSVDFARAASDGTAVVIGIDCMDGSRQQYALAPDLVIDLVAGLLSARSEAAMASGARPATILIEQLAATEGQVVITMFATPVLGLPFCVRPGLADELSSRLASVVATLIPREPDRQN